MNKKEVEKIVGYTFQNPDYLERALTHSSFNKEQNTLRKMDLVQQYVKNNHLE